jgi:hypothetical protein
MHREIDWGRLGLTGNPFENVLPGERLEWVDWPPGLAARLDTRPFAIQLLGPHKGAGKSTVLRASQAHLEQAGCRTHFVYVAPGATWRAPIPAGTQALLVDEANRLSWLGWRRVRGFRRRGGALLLATHVPAPLPGLETFALEPLALRGWIHKRCADHGWTALPPELERLLPEVERAAKGVNYRIQRLLYELLEDRVRGEAFDAAALARAVERLRSEP